MIRSEEQYLRSHFDEFDAYAARVPRLFPRVIPAPTNAAPGAFSRPLYLQHREYNALMGAIAIYAALGLRLFLISRNAR